MRRASADIRGAVLAAGAAGCVLAPPLMLARVDSPLRVVAALLLFCVAPGAALLPLLAPRSRGAELALVVGLSLAVCTLGGELMVTLGVFAPEAATSALAVACLVPIVSHLRRRP